MLHLLTAASPRSRNTRVTSAYGPTMSTTPSVVEASRRGVFVIANAPTPIRIQTAANMLILRIFILLLMAIKITAYAAALATLTRIGIVRMSGVVDFVSLVP